MKAINRLVSFIKADHRYVYLGTSVIAALGLAFSQRNPTPLSFLAPTGVFQDCLWAILWAWLVVSTAAFVTKLMHWSDYREKSPFASERFRRAARLGSYVVVAIAVVFFVDRCVMSFIDLVQVSIVSDSNPSDFLSSLVYMTYKSGDFFIRGIEITIALATFGTVIAFFWHCSLCFCAFRPSIAWTTTWCASLRASAAALRPSTPPSCAARP